MNYEDIKRILEEYKNKLGIEEEVKIKLRDYKFRSALVNLKTKTIYINKMLVMLGEEELIRYLILHELLHIKFRTKYHTEEFYKELYKFFHPEQLIKLSSRYVLLIIKIYQKTNFSSNIK